MLGLPLNVKDGAVDVCNCVVSFIRLPSLEDQNRGFFYTADRVLVRVCPSIARDSSVKIQVSTRCFKYNHLKSRYLTK
jgi:hypothetical protein